MSGKWKVTLADGSSIGGLSVNGSMFVSQTEITAAMFDGKLSRVKIEGTADAGNMVRPGEYSNMELVGLQHHEGTPGLEDGWYFGLREIPEAELEKLKNRGDIEYIAMMTGVEL